MNNKKVVLVVGIIVIVVLAVGGFLVFKNKKADTAIVNKADSVATVNGTYISKAVYDSQLATAIASLKTQGVDVEKAETFSQIKTQVLNDLISNVLVTDGIAKAGIKPSATDIETQFQAILKQAGGAEALKTELAKNNLTEAQLRDNIAKQLAVQTYLLQNIDVKSIKVSKDEIAQFYADYSKAQKDSGKKDVPKLAELSDQIKQQITANKQQTLINTFVASLREKAKVEISQ